MAIETYTPGELPAAFFDFELSAAIDPSAAALISANEHLLARDAQGEPVARCTLWWQGTPWLSGARAGYIGHYAARAATSPRQVESDAGHIQELLDTACTVLGKQGCAWAIGPVDGSTFGNYRFVTARRVNDVEYPRFFLEPDNADAWPGHFLQAGFAPLASYHSGLADLSATDPVLSILQQRAQAADATLRTIDLSQFDLELRRVFPVVTGSFQHNFLYTSIGEEEFMRQYLPVQAYLQPQLGWIAEKAGRAVGFLFALPDLAQAQRGEEVDTVILKTVGVLPDAGVLGLGNLLVAQCQIAAYGLGYRRAIHALMHDANISSKISRRYARLMRRYTLYTRRLH